MNILFIILLIVSVMFLLAMIIVLFLSIRKIDFVNKLTVREKSEIEKKIKKSKEYRSLIELKTYDKIAEELRLFIKKVDRSIINNNESFLSPSDNQEYVGVIQYALPKDGGVNEEYYKNFRCLHEIIHYVEDVGIGRRVRKSYNRVSGHTQTHHEQKIDYLAAAIGIPFSAISDNDIEEVLTKKNRQHIAKLSNQYNQTEEMICRRIWEIDSIRKLNNSSTIMV